MGTTQGKILISYDIDSEHTDVKEQMTTLGYSSDWYPLHLPNTTLWHKNTTSNNAINDLSIVCQKLNVKIISVVAVLANEFKVI